jgi:hypothetical protein
MKKYLFLFICFSNLASGSELSELRQEIKTLLQKDKQIARDSSNFFKGQTPKRELEQTLDNLQGKYPDYSKKDLAALFIQLSK